MKINILRRVDCSASSLEHVMFFWPQGALGFQATVDYRQHVSLITVHGGIRWPAQMVSLTLRLIQSGSRVRIQALLSDTEMTMAWQ